LRTAVNANFKMQHHLVAVVGAHLGDLAARKHLLALIHQPLAIVGVSAKHPVTVLDDDQFAVADEPAAAVHDLPPGGSKDRLT